ncbi:hypothetical protein QE152_g37111 [Popillia japonica]|uniref:Uncharacterized protein n=1 Tax=Popillia japonica TaxID=7064 RepID=A0AAW1IBG1_POPJA
MLGVIGTPAVAQTSIRFCSASLIYVGISHRILDLIFTNNPQDVGLVVAGQPVVAEDVHHPAVEFTCGVAVASSLQVNRRAVLDFKRTDYVRLKKLLALVDWHSELACDGVDAAVGKFYEILDWHSELACDGVDAAVGKFYEILNDLFRKCVPTKIIKKKPVTAWMLLLDNKKKKNKAHKLWRVYNNQMDYIRFSTLRRRSKYLIDDDFKHYIRRVEDGLTSSPADLWSYAGRRRRSCGIPREMRWGDSVANDGDAVCNLFNAYFASVFTNVFTNVTINYTPSGNAFGDLKLSIIRFITD